jgi:hypothetical protein
MTNWPTGRISSASKIRRTGNRTAVEDAVIDDDPAVHDGTDSRAPTTAQRQRLEIRCAREASRLRGIRWRQAADVIASWRAASPVH